MKNTKKKKQKKQKKQFNGLPIARRVLPIVFLSLSALMIYSAVNEIMTTVKLNQQLAEVQAKLQEVKDENTYLTQQKEKLQDPDYVESYARGNYQLSKDGEQIFYLPENTNK